MANIGRKIQDSGFKIGFARRSFGFFVSFNHGDTEGAERDFLNLSLLGEEDFFGGGVYSCDCSTC